MAVCHEEGLDDPRSDVCSLDDIEHLVLENVDWKLYEALLRNVGDRPLQLAYDDGILEITSPLPDHQRPKKFISRNDSVAGV